MYIPQTTPDPSYMTTTTEAPAARPLTLDDLRAEGTTVSVRRAAEYIGVSHAYAYHMARDGLLPTIKLGTRRIRVPTASLLRMLDPQDCGIV